MTLRRRLRDERGQGLISALKKHLSALHSRHGPLVELQVTGSERRLAAPWTSPKLADG